MRSELPPNLFLLISNLLKYKRNQNINEENKTFKFKRHISATPVPSSVYVWNYNDEQYIAEN